MTGENMKEEERRGGGVVSIRYKITSNGNTCRLSLLSREHFNYFFRNINSSKTQFLICSTVNYLERSNIHG